MYLRLKQIVYLKESFQMESQTQLTGFVQQINVNHYLTLETEILLSSTCTHCVYLRAYMQS